jgi:hypothetical protein
MGRRQAREPVEYPNKIEGSKDDVKTGSAVGRAGGTRRVSGQAGQVSIQFRTGRGEGDGTSTMGEGSVHSSNGFRRVGVGRTGERIGPVVLPSRKVAATSVARLTMLAGWSQGSKLETSEWKKLRT